jgi:hypothetical protein
MRRFLPEQKVYAVSGPLLVGSSPGTRIWSRDNQLNNLTQGAELASREALRRKREESGANRTPTLMCFCPNLKPEECDYSSAENYNRNRGQAVLLSQLLQQSSDGFDIR